MTDHIANIVRYFRSCYEADNRQTGISNFFGEQVEHRIFAHGEEELLTGLLTPTPVDVEQGTAARKAAALYSKEKELIYASFFLVGRQAASGPAARTVCAPLLLHPARLEARAGHVFLSIDQAGRRLNPRALEALRFEDDEAGLARELEAELGTGSVAFEQAAGLAAVLQQGMPDLEAQPLYAYPKLVTERALRRLLSRAGREVPWQIVPASAAALVRKSVETRGVLNELAEIADEGDFSAPLRILIGAETPPRPADVEVGRVPAVLSRAQEHVLERAARHPVSLVIGPPGTGKSFTIAALAMEHLGRGQSVLIASKMNHAVDVVGDVIERQLGIAGCVVRGGRRQYLRELKRYLSQLLGGMHTGDDPGGASVSRQRRDLKRLDRQIAGVEQQIDRRVRQELRWGARLAGQHQGLKAGLQRRYLGWWVRRQPLLWEQVDQLNTLLEHRTERTRSLLRGLNLQRIRRALEHHRPALSTFLRALRARHGSKQESLFEAIDFRVLLQAFPVWLVSLAEVHDVLPLRRHLFDLAVIDEATQCDVASCLPILQRARRVVVVGDPNQLRHLSFLSRGRQAALQDLHGLPPGGRDRFDYRERSILDFVDDALTSQEQVVFLNEHYRSVPPIIAFSNRKFYGGRLHVMTEKPNQPLPGALVLNVVPGTRRPSGVNAEEARQLAEQVAALVRSEQDLGPGLCHSIGVLSPFRDQVDHLSQALSEVLPVEALDRHRLLVGTAHTFQGEERDVMFLSFAVDSGAHSATLRFLEQPDVLNVSITRARTAQHIYLSRPPQSFGPDSLLGAYLRHVASGEAEPPKQGRGGGAADPFMEEVAGALRRQGAQVQEAYPIAGLVMDLVALDGPHSLGIDLIGYPGQHEAAFPLERYKMLWRAGIRVFPLPYARWLVEHGTVTEAVVRSLRPEGRP